MLKDFFNKNVYKFYKNLKPRLNIILFFVLIVILIWLIISNMIRRDPEETNEVEQKSSYRPSETVIQGSDVDEEDYAEEESIINTFVEYCNNGNIAEAYNMLSSDCKETLYPDQATFEQNYYNEIFSSYRTCNLQSWINGSNYTTYRVRYVEDIMSTGNYENSDKYQDYITVIKTEDGQSFLSINQYISKEPLENVKVETDEISIQVEYVENYVNYVNYTFTVQNKTDKTILLDSMQDVSETMYITTGADRKRTCDYADLSIIDLKIDPNATERITLQYNKVAGSEDEDREIHFSNIIKDYNLYLEDVSNYTDTLDLVIDLN